MAKHRFSAGVLAACGFVASCDGAVPVGMPGVDARVMADADVVVADARPTGVLFHGTPVGDWDRSMPDVDAIGYEVDLRVDESTAGSETYRAELRGVFVATRALDALVLDYDGEDVDAAEVDGRAATATRAMGALTVPLGRTVAQGTAFAVTLRYHGSLFQGTGANPNDFRTFGGLMVFQRNRAGRKIYESLNWPSKARRWLPTRDHPRDGAMLAMRATFPSAYTVMSNGRQEAVADNPDGTRTWSFFEGTPMPSYDIHIAAYGDWAETTEMSTRNGRTVRWLPYSGHVAAGRTLFSDLPPCMDFYEDTFGEFQWEQAVFLEVPIFGGGMEHATLVSMDESLFLSPTRNRSVSFHELAHHWSGNLVRIATWNDFWLSEGVTDYLTGRFMDAHEAPGVGLAHWRTYLNSALAAEFGARRHAMRPPEPEVDVLDIFDAISYKKGAFVLRVLERRLGTMAFTTFLRGWFERHARTAMRTAQFEEELDAAFPGMGVRDFFRQWVYGQGIPVVDVSARYDGAMGRATVTVRQTQTIGPTEGYVFPVAVELVRGTMRQRATINVTGRMVTQDVPVTFEPSSVVVDPDEVSYLAAACGMGSSCREGYTCSAVGTSTQVACLPPRE